MSRKKITFRNLALGLSAVLLFLTAGPLRVWMTHGDKLGARSVQLSNNQAGATSNYVVSFSGQSDGSIRAIRAQFCSNDPLIGTACIPPDGFSLSGATLSSQTGLSNFTINTANSTANVLVLSRPRGSTTDPSSSYTLQGVVNPATEGSYYVRLETFGDEDASGNDVDYGGLAFEIGGRVQISTTVPPYLLFCTGITIQPYDCGTADGSYIDFGDFNANVTSTGHTELLAATNGANGYTIRVIGTTLTSGNNEIPPLANSDISRTGVSQFGLNLRANITPVAGQNAQGPGSGSAVSGYNTPDFYRYNSGEIIASSAAPDSYRLYTANYIVNIAKNQSPGVYVSTITYAALANF